MSISLMVLFGLPPHFHLLLCDCLVLSLIVFCSKEIENIKKSRQHSWHFRQAHYELLTWMLIWLAL